MTATHWQPLLACPAHGHIAQIYQDGSFLNDAVKLFIRSGLDQGNGVIVITTTLHRQGFARELNAEGVNLNEAVQNGQLICLDTETTLSKFMVNNMPDWDAFRETIGTVIEKLQVNYSEVRAYGEMVDTLWQQGNYEATIRLEEFWNDLAKIYPFSLFCTYFMDNLHEEAYEGHLDAVCRTHSHLIPFRDYDQIDKALNEAGEDVLGQSLGNMLSILSVAEGPLTKMPTAQATMLWLKKHMPLTAHKIFSRVRVRCNRLV